MDCTLIAMADWDAARYHRVSDPQRGWGLRVLSRLQPRDNERVLDIGCGTGRLTSEIANTPNRIEVIGVDRSPAMVAEAARHYGSGIAFAVADATSLPFGATFDAVFSTATFHWVLDHDRLFAEIHRVLRPGGRLIAQAGGGENLARLRRRSAALAKEAPFAPFFTGWSEPWHYAGVDDTRARLLGAGFRDVEVWLEEAPTRFGDAGAYSEFVSCVCVRRELDLLPAALRERFADAITRAAAGDDPPFTLDYWRLNINARKV